MFKTLEELIAIIRERKGSSPEKSYTNKLLSDKKNLHKILEKGAKVTASWKGLSGKQQEIPDRAIEDVIYTDRGTEYVIRWNNGNNLIQLPADSVEGEEPKEAMRPGQYQKNLIKRQADQRAKKYQA